MNKPDKFINPYNFVNLGDGVERRAYEEYEHGNLTGKISCSLEVKTPLAIPDSEKKYTEEVLVKKNKDKSVTEKHAHYPFYRVDDKAVIPGSQIRGVIRSAYETLSNSCFSVYNEAFDILSSRSSAIRNPGIIQYYDGKYRLFEANMKKFKNIKVFNEYQPDELETKRIWYGTESKKEFAKRKESEIAKGKNPPRFPKTITKHYVFSDPDYEVECCNLEKAIKDYNLNFDIYRTNAGTNPELSKSTAFEKYSRNNKKEVIPLKEKDPTKLYPVFYYEVMDNEGNNYVYLLPSQIGRTVYSNRVQDLLGTYRSCVHEEGKVCSACYLFGIITQAKQKLAYASKIRFSDAKLSSEKFYSEKDVTLYELSSPKISSTEFYSKKPGTCKYWTYDYMIEKYSGDSSCPEETIQLCKTELNGRKYYLHYPNISKADYNDSVKTNRNCSMELAETGNEFKFDVYFENITEKQLKELLWTLTIGENKKESRQQYKLGHGKPLGLGSVKITVDNIEIRHFDKDTLTYSMENPEVEKLISQTPFDTNSKYFKDFMLITNVDTAGKCQISYPIVDDGNTQRTNSNAVHQWFSHNRKSGSKGTGVGWNLKYSLPPIDAEDLSLPSYKYKK